MKYKLIWQGGSTWRFIRSHGGRVWVMFVTAAALILSSLNVYASAFIVADFSTSLDYAQVTSVVAIQGSDGNWCFDTTVRHNDEGWGHYADGWEVVDEWHKVGFANGGTRIEEAPGERGTGSRRLFMAYLLDPQDNKVCVTHFLS